MICPICHAIIPEHKIACPACVARRSFQSVLELQKAFLPALVRGEHPLTLSKPAEEAGWHFAFLCYGDQAWCGRTLSPLWKKLYRAYPDIQQLQLCGACRAALERLARELEHAETGRHV